MTERAGDEDVEQWRVNLNPPSSSGDDRGPPRWEEFPYRTAYDLKDVHGRLQEIEDDDLQRIPIVPPGMRLEQGATYLDLRDPRPHEFTATADMTAHVDNAYVLKSEVSYPVWNRLLELVAGGGD